MSAEKNNTRESNTHRRDSEEHDGVTRIPSREQLPSPDQGNPPRTELDPSQPTATAPESVEHSVYEEAEHAGKDGENAADPTEAAKKSGGRDTVTDHNPGAHDAEGDDQTNGSASGDSDRVEPPGADLDPDEAADVFETREEAQRIKQTRDDQRDENLISLDPGD